MEHHVVYPFFVKHNCLLETDIKSLMFISSIRVHIYHVTMFTSLKMPNAYLMLDFLHVQCIPQHPALLHHFASNVFILISSISDMTCGGNASLSIAIERWCLLRKSDIFVPFRRIYGIFHVWRGFAWGSCWFSDSLIYIFQSMNS